MVEDKDNRKEASKSGAAEADRLRDEIDRGGAGDKVSFSDPAAAPLGTDDEAGGNPPSADQAATARHQESRRAEAEHVKPEPGDRQTGSSSQKARLGMVAVIAVVCLIVLLLVFN